MIILKILPVRLVALKNYLDSLQTPGVEELKMDVDLTNPEITLTIDRERAMIEGVNSAQIGQQIRTALFGREVSKIKDNKDEYKIQLRNTGSAAAESDGPAEYENCFPRYIEWVH